MVSSTAPSLLLRGGRYPLAACAVSLLCALGCDSGRDGADAGPVDRSDSGVRDASASDGGFADASAGDGALADGSAGDARPLADAGVHIDERGFPIRVPQRRQVPCMGRGGPPDPCPSPMVEAEDVDFVCTLRHGARDRHFVYVQSRPTRLDPGLALVPLPIYTRDGAWVSDGVRVIAMDRPGVYDYGGGHHNDSMTVDLGDTVYRYYHSSFGFGFRRCQEMDCLQAFAPGATTPTTDGCTRDRLLPIVCVRVASDGSVPALTDTFMRCPGDGS